MSYWVICVYSLFMVFSKKVRFDFILLCLSVYIIYVSESRSGILAILFFVISIFFKAYTGFRNKKSRNLLTFIFFVLMMFSFLSYKVLNIELQTVSLPDSEKISSLQNRVLSTDVEEQLRIRGYMRPFDYPEFLIFGAGKGLDERFNSPVEIHSSWVALFFYYGFVGFVLFFVVYFQYMNMSRWDIRFCMLAPLFYGISTYGLRTPIFWIYLSVVFYAILHERRKIEY
ncbi:hypothetical protein [Vibrio vulnificus]|uniref:hypothetical protein n=1 Tax=Vibrio vulnificus TaxID=672 RepID=UPI002231C8E6|nr:hypothetical protein [Vibrio vulnificus]